MSDVKISVIMPVYKVEKYVGRAIESMQRQTLSSFELLLVDDGTPDRSGEICEEYAASDARLRVLHKENGGAPSARNAAIEIARGKYLYFMDSDDWAESDMLEKMYQKAEEQQAQLVVSGFFIDTYYDEEHFISEVIREPAADYADRQSFRAHAYRYFDHNMLYTPWNKLYLASYIRENDLRFPKTLWDDFPFNLSVVRDVERVSVLEECFYHFIRVREESETAAYQPAMYGKREEEHGWMVDLYRYWNMDDEASREMIARRYIERFIGCIENLTNPKSGLNSREIRENIRKMLENPRVKESLERAQPRSVYMKLMLLPVRWKSVFLLYMEGRVITRIKRGNRKVFARLKAGR